MDKLYKIEFKEKPNKKPLSGIPPNKLPKKNFLAPIRIDIIN
jgi:hypothetical protein